MSRVDELGTPPARPLAGRDPRRTPYEARTESPPLAAPPLLAAKNFAPRLANDNGIHYPFWSMYVCICHAVDEADVRDAIDRGAGSVADVTRACKAGGDCGACHEQIAGMIADGQCSGPIGRLVPLRTRAA